MVLAGLVLVSTMSAVAAAQPVLNWHFAGTDEVLRSNPEAFWGEASKIKPAAAFESQIKGRFSTWLSSQLGWTDRHWAGGPSFTRLLLDDLFRNESYGAVSGNELSTASWAFTVHLDSKAQERWSSALMSFGRQTHLGEPEKLSIAGATGWRIPGQNSGTGVSFVIHGEWLIATGDFDANSTAVAWAEALEKNGRPGAALKEGWLEMSIDPEILKWNLVLPVVGKVQRWSASFSWKNESVGMSASVLLADDFKPGRGKWLTPKKIILDPLVSFTAMRGVADWVGHFGAFQALPKESLPNQLFSWTRGDVAFLHDFAMPVADPEKAFSVLSKSVPASYNEKIMEYSLGQWINATNTSRLLWRGLPVFVPYLSPATLDDQGYLIGGIFPLVNAKDPQPAPQALFDQIESRDELIYYDWEISAARIRAFEQASRFVGLIFATKGQQDDAFGVQWMNLISGKLENAITEATVAGDRELKIERKSTIGVTGIELWMLAHWLDGKEFPSFPYAPPAKRGEISPADEQPLPAAKPVR